MSSFGKPAVEHTLTERKRSEPWPSAPPGSTALMFGATFSLMSMGAHSGVLRCLVFFKISPVNALNTSRRISQMAHGLAGEDGVCSGAPNAIAQTTDGIFGLELTPD